MTKKRDRSTNAVKALFSTPSVKGTDEDEGKAQEVVEAAVPQSVETVVNSASVKAPISRGRRAAGRETEARNFEASQENLSESLRFLLTPTERARIEAFISNEYSRVKTLSDICRRAIADYLDKEEPLLEEIGKAVSRIQKRS